MPASEMHEPNGGAAPDVTELVGRDVPPGELSELRRVDALLRAAPPPSSAPQPRGGWMSGLRRGRWAEPGCNEVP
jgi:hypothetical protein